MTEFLIKMMLVQMKLAQLNLTDALILMVMVCQIT